MKTAILAKLLLLPLFLLASCSTTPEPKKKATGDKVDYTFEQFIATPTYAISGDFWRGAAILERNPAKSRVEILLNEQRGRLYINDKIAMDFPVCTGKENTHETPTGSYHIQQKVENHRSSLYGSYVDKDGSIIKSNIRVTDARPKGAIYRGSKLPYWMRFSGSYGIHEGEVWRKSASHGCVRVPEEVAKILFEKLECGSRVIIKGGDADALAQPAMAAGKLAE